MESNKLLVALGVTNGVIDPRSGQQSVKATFSTENAAEDALDKYRALRARATCANLRGREMDS